MDIFTLLNGDDALDGNYANTGFAGRLGFGKKPVLLLIDLAEAYFRPGSPLYHPRFQAPLESSARLRKAAHAAGIPVILTRVEIMKGGADAGIFYRKAKIPMDCFETGNPLADFSPLLEHDERDIVLTKRYPSSFYGTHLAAMLTAMGVDSVIIGGQSTSGCVRATALDTVQNGFIPIVVADACGDRHPAPHEQNLFDINAKMGDVVSEAEILDYMAGYAATQN